MSTAQHLVIGTDHPFSQVVIAALQRRDDPDAVWTTDEMTEVEALVGDLHITDIFLLSGAFPTCGPDHPTTAWHRMTRNLLTVLGVAKEKRVKVFWPSSIAVFGSSAPAEHCPPDAAQETNSLFAICKRAGEQWCRQYREEHGVDVRSLRLPVLIRPSRAVVPTEDPNPETQDQSRPVLHLEDAAQAALELMAALRPALSHCVYPLAGVSVSLAEVETELKAHSPELAFDVWNLPEYAGPCSLDDKVSRSDWGWKPRCDLVNLIKSLFQS